MTTTVTKADVVAKFKELHKNYYSSDGYMISIVDDDVAEKVFATAKWNEVYNRYASDRNDIRSTNATVPFMGYEFQMEFHRPLVMEHRYEFELYFSFGGHCDGFNVNRTVACFPNKIDEAIDIDEILLKDQCETDPVDAEYAKRAIILLALGGYVKFWKAVHVFEQWFVDVAGIPECKEFNETRQMLECMFEVMQFKTDESITP